MPEGWFFSLAFPQKCRFWKTIQRSWKKRCPLRLILGEDELDKNEIKIKDFRSGNEKSVSQQSLIEQVEISMKLEEFHKENSKMKKEVPDFIVDEEKRLKRS